jgi:hypothetical protein
MSYDGLCGYQNIDNREGKYVNIISEGVYKFDEMPLHSAVWNDVYFAFYEDYAVCFDFKNKLQVYRRSIEADYAIYDNQTDKLLVYLDDVVYSVGDGDDLEWTFLTVYFHAKQIGVNHHFRRYWIVSSGEVEVNAYTDIKTAEKVTVKGTGRRKQFLPAGMRGQYISFIISGNCVLNSIDIEFSIIEER